MQIEDGILTLHKEGSMVEDIGVENLARAIREFAFVYLVCHAPKGVSFMDAYNIFAIVVNEEGHDAFRTTTFAGK